MAASSGSGGTAGRRPVGTQTRYAGSVSGRRGGEAVKVVARRGTPVAALRPGHSVPIGVAGLLRL
jgi:hypothetical protein